jgi:hypothetical protein
LFATLTKKPGGGVYPLLRDKKEKNESQIRNNQPRFRFHPLPALHLKAALLTGHQGFQTAQGINNSLGNLYILLANNYISPRRAAVLAFINSLQLRTLPAIDADQAAGIIDPTAPKEVLAEPDTPPSEASSDPAATPADSSASPSDTSTSTSPTRNTPPGWLTEPDPTKKPS